MPSKNIVKNYVPFNYYHVYNRGVDKQLIFRDNDDKLYLTNLFKNRSFAFELGLNIGENKGKKNLLGTSEILSFCLMNNHYHILFWLDKDPESIKRFMQNVFTSYTMHFNKKYERIGPLFQSRYKASPITSDPYLTHISRYIHLNPTHYDNYAFSSYKDFVGEPTFPFVQPDRILKLFEFGDYESFTREGVENKDSFHFS